VRVYGRTYDKLGNATWVEVQTDANGLNDYVYLTALIQELKLNLQESPMWGTRGLPAQESVISQVAPTYYVMLMQQRYAPFFQSIVITRVPPGTTNPGQITSRQPSQIPRNANAPTYNISILTNYGVQLEVTVPT